MFQATGETVEQVHYVRQFPALDAFGEHGPGKRVTTKRLNEQVKRNRDRFPEDFLFRLTREETKAVNWDPRFPPYAFTEHCAIMAATVVNSPRAVDMSIYAAIVGILGASGLLWKPAAIYGIVA